MGKDAEEHGPSMGLFARAQHFFKNPVASTKSALKDTDKVLQQFGRSTAAWVLMLQDLTPRQKKLRPLAMKVLQQALCMVAGTQTVERWLGEMKMAELKSRAHALNDSLLETCMKLNVQSFHGRRLGKAFDPDELIQGIANSRQRGVRYKGTNYLLRCQNLYREFYGEKVLKCRALEGDSSSASEKPSMGKIHAASSEKKRSMQTMQEEHSKAVKNVVAASGKSASLTPMVENMKEVSAARSSCSLSDAPTGSKDAPPASKRKLDEHLGEEEPEKPLICVLNLIIFD